MYIRQIYNRLIQISVFSKNLESFKISAISSSNIYLLICLEIVKLYILIKPKTLLIHTMKIYYDQIKIVC